MNTALYAPGQGVAEHCHSGLHIQYILSGAIQFTCLGRSQLFGAGTACVFAPELAHFWQCTDSALMVGALLKARGAHREQLNVWLRESTGPAMIDFIGSSPELRTDSATALFFRSYVRPHHRSGAGSVRHYG